MTDEERLEQIRQVNEEISYLIADSHLERDSLARKLDAPILRRMLASRESALADLKRGMRTAAPDGARRDSDG